MKEIEENIIDSYLRGNNWKLFKELIQKHPKVENINTDMQVGNVMLTFKGKNDIEVYATPFWDGIEGIPIDIYNENGDDVVYHLIKLKDITKILESFENFTNWYYSEIDNIFNICFNKNK